MKQPKYNKTGNFILKLIKNESTGIVSHTVPKQHQVDINEKKRLK